MDGRRMLLMVCWLPEVLEERRDELCGWLEDHLLDDVDTDGTVECLLCPSRAEKVVLYAEAFVTECGLPVQGIDLEDVPDRGVDLAAVERTCLRRRVDEMLESFLRYPPVCVRGREDEVGGCRCERSEDKERELGRRVLFHAEHEFLAQLARIVEEDGFLGLVLRALCAAMLMGSVTATVAHAWMARRVGLYVDTFGACLCAEVTRVELERRLVAEASVTGTVFSTDQRETLVDV